MKTLLIILISIIFNPTCSLDPKIDQKSSSTLDTLSDEIIPGANALDQYIPLIQGRNIGLVVNHTSIVDDAHLVDTLYSLGQNISKIFTPEHGYKGTADAGEHVGTQNLESAQVVSLYGKKKKPSPEDLEGIDVLVFDIQDVGVRFYTYISTLHYVMEAAAENGIPVIVLDRPNPNGFYVDGPILDPKFQSFVGMHPVPVVYGMNIGEYAQMINGEGWLANQVKCDLTVIKCKNYCRSDVYELPIKPSPNLPNQKSILLYPSLCYFEGTHVSVGRGTDKQFQVIGHPELNDSYTFEYTPISREGAKYPKHENKKCYGIDLSNMNESELIKKGSIDLSYLIKTYHSCKQSDIPFFIENNFFDKLAGSGKLKQQIISGMSAEEISDTWQNDINQFKKTRSKYLLYKNQ